MAEKKISPKAPVEKTSAGEGGKAATRVTKKATRKTLRQTRKTLKQV